MSGRQTDHLMIISLNGPQRIFPHHILVIHYDFNRIFHFRRPEPIFFTVKIPDYLSVAAFLCLIKSSFFPLYGTGFIFLIRCALFFFAEYGYIALPHKTGGQSCRCHPVECMAGRQRLLLPCLK